MATARDEFAEKGFADAATNDVVGKTGLTRGALYHHFEDKQALFEAVYVNEQIRVLNTLQPGIERARTRDEAISAGIDAFLESMAERGTHRILLTDGPAVMGWTRWRELDSKYVLGAFERILSETRDKDDYAIPVPATVSKMVVSAMSEAVQLIAAAEDPE
ncbi:MAG: helix-turn-helix domain-containing protein, partial [Pseudomonadota bacterium]